MTFSGPDDPTSSAIPGPAHPSAATRLSRNEIEALGQKAARGAGMAWGLAEEAGFAAGWLAARGIDGAGALLAHLQGLSPGAIAVRDRHWQETSGAALCPILLGAALDDHALLDAGPCAASVTSGAVRQPVLLVPFLARAARACAKPLALTWSGGTAVVLASGDVDAAALASLSRVDLSALTLCATSDTARCADSAPAMVALSAATLAGLHALALRTTVPASDASRRGAGAAVSDND